MIRVKAKVGVAAIVAALFVAFGAFGLGSTTASAASDPHIGGLVVDVPLSATSVNISGLVKSAEPVDSRLDSSTLPASSVSGIAPVTVTGGMSFLLSDVTNNLNFTTNNTARDCVLICVGPPATIKVAASPNAACAAAVTCSTVTGLNILGPTASTVITRPDGTPASSLPSKQGGSLWSLLDNGFRPLDRATPNWLSPTSVDGQVPDLNVPHPTTDNGPAVLPRAADVSRDNSSPFGSSLRYGTPLVLLGAVFFALFRRSRPKAKKLGPSEAPARPRPPTFGTLSTS